MNFTSILIQNKGQQLKGGKEVKNIFLEMEIEVCKSIITAQEKELEKANNDWSQGFHEGLKLAYERNLEGLIQIKKEMERNDSQRTSAEPLAR